MTGISSSSFSLFSISIHLGADISSRFIPPKPGAINFTVFIISSDGYVLTNNHVISAADEIIVNPSSLVGSIGVIMPNYGVNQLLQKLGVEDRTMTSGENKALLSMTQPVDAAQKAHVQGVLDNVHNHFINAVKEGRGDRLKNPEQNKLFSGLFWTGDQYIELGLADKKGSISSLEKQLKLDNVVNYTPSDPFQLFMDRFAVKLGAGVGSSINLDLLPQEEGNAQMR